MSLTIDQMRDLLGLGPEVPAEEVVDRYAAWLEGEPAAELLSLEEVKKHLKVEIDDDDTLITGYIAGAIDALDGETGSLGRSVTRQTRVHRLNGFETAPIRLPYPPVVSITSVVHANGAAGFGTVDPLRYELIAGRILQPVFGASWPIVAPAAGAVVITYEAGYSALPPAMRAALLLMIGDLYAARETFTAGVASAVPMSTTVKSLLRPFEVFA